MKQFFTIAILSFLNLHLTAQNLRSAKPVQENKIADNNSSKKSGAGAANNSAKPIDFNGQWKGSFTDNSSGLTGFGDDKIDYVLELDCNGSAVTGYSYTYFMGGAKRFYTICKLKGTLNRTTKEIVVTEFERTKYNTSPDFRNCFQTHRLRYIKDSDDVETLEGSWMPAPNQTGGCGFGKTLLTRRLMKNMPLINSTKTSLATVKKDSSSRNLNRPYQPAVASKKKTTVVAQNKKPAASPVTPPAKTDLAKDDDVIKNSVTTIAPPIKPENQQISPHINFEKRSNSLLKTIEVLKDTLNVELYDDGEIDGDSVSVFFNGALLLSHQRLSDKPISLLLRLNKSAALNELTIYAENLGAIPPNTALMIVTDGSKRYEVRVNSDTEKNASIAFIHKK